MGELARVTQPLAVTRRTSGTGGRVRSASLRRHSVSALVGASREPGAPTPTPSPTPLARSSHGGRPERVWGGGARGGRQIRRVVWSARWTKKGNRGGIRTRDSTITLVDFPKGLFLSGSLSEVVGFSVNGSHRFFDLAAKSYVMRKCWSKADPSIKMGGQWLLFVDKSTLRVQRELFLGQNRFMHYLRYVMYLISSNVNLLSLYLQTSMHEYLNTRVPTALWHDFRDYAAHIIFTCKLCGCKTEYPKGMARDYSASGFRHWKTITKARWYIVFFCLDVMVWTDMKRPHN